MVGVLRGRHAVVVGVAEGSFEGAAEAVLVAAGEEGSAGGRAHEAVGVEVREAEAGGGEVVEVGGCGGFCSRERRLG